jgi:hypothetical protein
LTRVPCDELTFVAGVKSIIVLMYQALRLNLAVAVVQLELAVRSGLMTKEQSAAAVKCRCSH